MSNDNIGFITALPAEAASLSRLQRHSNTIRFELASTGIGPEAATKAAESLLARGVTLLISWGTGGGLEPGLAPGTLVIYESAVDADGTEFPCDSTATAWLQQRLKFLAPVTRRGLSSAIPIAAANAKSALHRQFNCAVVDMESTAIAAAARAAGIAFAAVRVIVDPAHYSLPATALAALGPTSGQFLRTLNALRQRPAECGPMIALGWWYFRAIMRLSHAARLILINANRTV
jgi:adenosylhomocysteine nucleosidase